MKQKLALLRNRSIQMAAGSGGFLVAAGSAHAALPPEATAAFTGISDDYTALAAVAWPVAGTVVGGMILLKLFKKMANKAT